LSFWRVVGELGAPEERGPEVFDGDGPRTAIHEAIRAESRAGPDDEAVEGDEAARGELAVEDDIEGQVQQHAQDPSPQPFDAGEPRDRGEQHEQLIGVQHEDDPLHLAGEIVAEEAAGTEIALTLEEHVVHHVVHVDQEAARREARGEREVLGARVDGSAGERGGDEVASGTDDEPPSGGTGCGTGGPEPGPVGARAPATRAARYRSGPATGARVASTCSGNGATTVPGSACCKLLNYRWASGPVVER